MVNYRDLKLGDRIMIKVHEFDGDMAVFGTIVNVLDNHVIMRGDDALCYWIDEDTQDQFYKFRTIRREIE